MPKLTKGQREILDKAHLHFKCRYDKGYNRFAIWRADAGMFDYRNADYSRLINLGLIEKDGEDGISQGGVWYKISAAGNEWMDRDFKERYGS